MAEPAAVRQVPPQRADTPTVVVDDLHVSYRIYEDRKPTLRRLVAERFKPRPFREIKAVQGVSITAYPGEALGIIGPNGGGKSTLLRAIAGLIPPRAGAVWARSEPTLLGVKAALHAGLSGRRNVVLGGLALGMTRRQVEARYDDIVEFAGVGEFMDMPLRAYSSGMMARLHFAIASAVLPEILLIDEALSVGDEDFKKKSEARIRELLVAAGTVFLVSHNLNFIQENCSRVLWLHKGRIHREGDPAAVIRAYRSTIAKRGPQPARSHASGG